MALIIKREVQKTAENKANEIRQINTQLFNSMKNLYARAFNVFWNDRDFSPSEISGAFGAEALRLFMTSTQIQGMLKSIDPSYVFLTPPEKYIIAPNQDGTVTITEKVVVPEPVVEQPTEPSGESEPA